MKKLLCILLSFALFSCSFIKYSVQDVVEIGYNSTVYVQTDVGHCTGFAIDYDIIVTAAHCIDLPNVFMKFGDNVILGVVLTEDKERDITIIHTTERIPGIIPALINEQILQPGEKLTAVGFPFYSGEDITFNIGYFLGYAEEHLMATDVCFRGNSGGPVFDELGQVIGMCSKIAPMIDIYDGFHHSHRDINVLVPIKQIRELIK